MITEIDKLKSLLTYDPETGDIRWRVDRAANAKAGDIAGAINEKGYRRIEIEGKVYRAHRVAFAFMTGFWPVAVDHKNRVKTDNRWDNLREATTLQNNRNRDPQRNNTSGWAGVDRHKNRWRASIRVGGKKIHLGAFVNKADAVSARIAANAKYFGAFQASYLD